MEEENIPSSQGSAHFDTEPQIDEGKCFNDPIHGTIRLHPLLVKIVDTPQFQRLRNIKQLGATYFVYPGASHNRFEHCIGTSHLAWKLVCLLKEKHPELNITEVDILCVEMAGLCHDLGHGPYSHMFDDMFLPEAGVQDWTHEEGSCQMLDYLIKENDLEDDLKHEDITDGDLTFVKEMIKPTKFKDTDPWPYKGRGEEKSFLYEIISNERNKVDVDKWDYFARDCHHLGMRNSFDHNRFMQFVRVLKLQNGRLQICVRDKECTNLYEMFHMRNALHRRAYQHRVCNAIELMICDAFLESEKSKTIEDLLGKKLSECVSDHAAFTKLDDGIFGMILRAEDAGNGPEILNNIMKRKLYQYLGTAVLKAKTETSSICQHIAKLTTEFEEDDPAINVEEDDLAINEVKYNYGMGASNPIDEFLFYSKRDTSKPYKIRKEDISAMLPGKFEEREVQVFCKKKEKKEKAIKCLKQYCKNNNLRLKTGEELITPMKRSSTAKLDAGSAKKKILHHDTTTNRSRFLGGSNCQGNSPRSWYSFDD